MGFAIKAQFQHFSGAGLDFALVIPSLSAGTSPKVCLCLLNDLRILRGQKQYQTRAPSQGFLVLPLILSPFARGKLPSLVLRQKAPLWIVDSPEAKGT